MHPTASQLVTMGIAAVALIVTLAIVLGIARVSSKRGAWAAALLAMVWLGATGALGVSGVLRRWDQRPPPLLLFIVVSLVGAAALSRSSVGRRLAEGLPLAALVGFQAFRLPLELVMHAAANEGTMPPQMSFGGWNYDIVSGITAALLATALVVFAGKVPRWVVMAWNALGTTLLAVIVGVALVSTPAIAAFGPARLNTWVGWFPFVWMIAVNVPGALLGHLVVWRKLGALGSGRVVAVAA